MTLRLFKINTETSEREENIDSVLSFTWNDDVSQVFTYFKFTSPQRYSCGDRIELFDDFSQETVLFGMITHITQNQLGVFTYEGYDYGFYLCKNTAIIQFNNQTVSGAIESLCNKSGLRVGTISNIQNRVTKIYRGETLDRILFDIYEMAVNNGLEDEFFVDCRNGRVNLFQCERNNDIRGYIADSYSINSFNNIMGVNNTQSINDLKNSVELWSSNPMDKTPVIFRQNQQSIERYGTLNQIETVNEKQIVNISEYIENRLNTLNQITETFSLTVYSDFHLRKGVIFQLNNERVNMEGSFVVVSSEHQIQGTEERVKVSLNRFRN